MANEVENKVENFFHNKWTWIGLGIGGIAVAYYFHKKNQSAAANASTTTDTSTSNTSGDSTDSSYGYDSGYSPIDSGTSAYGTVPSAYQYDPTTGQYEYTGTLGVTAPSTNVQWSQMAESQLTADGYDPITVAAALGKYILGAEMTQDQYGIVQAAIALVGPTPQAVPPAHVAPPPSQSSTPVTGTKPKVLGKPSLRVGTKSKYSANLYWTPVIGASEYNVYRDGAMYRGTRFPEMNVPLKGSYFVYPIPNAVNAHGYHTDTVKSKSNTVTV